MKIILSCTTTFERRKLLYYTLQSFGEQSLKPDILLINISKDAYLSDSGFDEIPHWLNENNIDLDVRVNWTENTGPYRKLIPAINYANNDDLIITADDDVLYHKSWLKNLVKFSEKNPDCIVAGRARRIRENIFYNWQNYSNWELIGQHCISKKILPIGCDGVLYKKGLLDLDFLTNKEFLKLCPKTDDLWFKFASLLQNIEIFYSPDIAKNNIYLQHPFGLENDNLNNNLAGNVLGVLNKISLRIKNYLGINVTNNDKNWDKIHNYLLEYDDSIKNRL